MTAKDVTERTDGERAVTEDNMSDPNQTATDPRQNAAQALELAFLVAEMLHQRLQAARRAAV
jgi:3-deoxy-7-phosphoheptulonate synthase